MEEKKKDFSNTQEELSDSQKLPSKSILRSYTNFVGVNKSPIKQSQTVRIRKSVSFPDRAKQMPLCTIHEIEPIVYENPPSNNIKVKTKCCVMF